MLWNSLFNFLVKFLDLQVRFSWWLTLFSYDLLCKFPWLGRQSGTCIAIVTLLEFLLILKFKTFNWKEGWIFKYIVFINIKKWVNMHPMDKISKLVVANFKDLCHLEYYKVLDYIWLYDHIRNSSYVPILDFKAV